MTQLVLLGTGTPNACPENSGPATAVVVDGKAYIFDFGLVWSDNVPKHILKVFMPYILKIWIQLSVRICIQTIQQDCRICYLHHGYWKEKIL